MSQLSGTTGQASYAVLLHRAPRPEDSNRTAGEVPQRIGAEDDDRNFCVTVAHDGPPLARWILIDSNIALAQTLPRNAAVHTT